MPKKQMPKKTQLINPVKAEQKVQIIDFQILNYSQQDLNKGPDYLFDLQQKIRKFYLKPQIQPQHFCSYAGFARVFAYPNVYQAYKNQNLNIIEMHLKYHQFIHQKMSIYKWAPSLVVAVATKFKATGLLFPLIYTNLIDLYFQKFFIWKYSNDKIINIQPEFNTKLTKPKNILRRAMLFGRLKNDLAKSNEQIPLKYLKFGQTTQYIFHTKMNDTEQSSIYLTSAFQNYMRINSFRLETLKQLWDHLTDLKNSFKEYKKIENKDQLPIFINYKRLLSYKDIRQYEIYNLTKQMELRVRRMLEIAKYAKEGRFFMSGFSFTDLYHINKHYDLLSPQRYNYQSNASDLVLFYGTIFAFKLMKVIIKRAIKM